MTYTELENAALAAERRREWEAAADYWARAAAGAQSIHLRTRCNCMELSARIAKLRSTVRGAA